MILYGYNRGIIFFESDNKSCDYWFEFGGEGIMSIFTSLIIVLNKVNDSYTIYDLNDHTKIRKTILEKYKSYGIKELNYDPAIFDSGDPKFAWVKQNYSATSHYLWKIQKRLKVNNYNLNKFFGI